MNDTYGHDAGDIVLRETARRLVTIPASIGVADTRTIGSDAGMLLAAADHAMYETKRARHRTRELLAIG